MRKMLIVLIIGMFSFVMCSDDAVSPTDENGMLRMSITDAFVEISSLEITISEIAIHKDGEWIEIDSVDHTIDLVQYNNGNVFELFDESLEPGTYSQIRLMLDNAEIVYEGQTYPLTIPSSLNTGLKLVNSFEILAGVETSLILDFDVNRSVHITGSSQNPQFKMKPTIRVIEESESGRITGTVTNLDTTAMAYAFAGTDTVTTSPVLSGGTFVLAFLEEGEYGVKVEDANGLIYENASVAVVKNQATDLGEITVQ